MKFHAQPILGWYALSFSKLKKPQVRKVGFKDDFQVA